MSRVRARRWRSAAAAVAVSATVLVSGCGGTATNVAVIKTSASFAELPGSSPNYMLPLASLQYFSVANISQFQKLMYRPLYWFGDNGQVLLNNSLSLADPPVYSASGKSVTVTLKGWKWSDGTQITARDIQFWQNLVTANKDEWAGYSPGEYPDNVLSSTINPRNPLRITFNLGQAYGEYFFTYNELSQITPLPQHVWDKESASGPVGNYDETPAGAQAVYTYLNSQSKSISTYDTNPLWQVVSGPWKLKSMDTAGNVSMVPNTVYGGPIKPTLKSFKEAAFSADSVEFNQLKSASSVSDGAVDYGYVPFEYSSRRTAVNHVYSVAPWAGWQITYVTENFTNPVSGPLFSQLYFRQAMQDLVDQNTFITRAFAGFGYPTYGPVPMKPGSIFVDPVEKLNPYPFSPAAAVALLKAHGWTVNEAGISTCAAAGSGSSQCGPGIPRGARASFSLQYESENPAVAEQMSQLKTDFAHAGIELKLTSAPFDTVIDSAIPGELDWDLAFWSSGWTYAPDYEPTGDEVWACTGSGAVVQYAGADAGGYCNAQAEQDIVATMTSNDVHAMYTYENYLARELPVIWMPVAYAQLSAINKALHGTGPQDPLLQIYPESWRWS